MSPRPPALQADSLPLSHQGSPDNDNVLLPLFESFSDPLTESNGLFTKRMKAHLQSCKDKIHQICVTLDFLQFLIEPQFFTL